MEKTLYFNDNMILAFHIGRGGKFHNAGHKSCEGEHKIGEYIDDLFLHDDGHYYDEGGNNTGLTTKEVESGIGIIDFDGLYNTIYTMPLGSIKYTDQEAWAAVHESDAFTREQVILYFLNGETREHQEIILEELGVDVEEYL